MGLDINYYGGLRKEDDLTKNDEGYYINIKTKQILEYDAEYTSLYINPHFPERCEDIDADVVYSYEEEGRFRAGSYGVIMIGEIGWLKLLAMSQN